MATCTNGPLIATLLDQIHAIATKHSVFTGTKGGLKLRPSFEWVHGGDELTAPTVAAWISPTRAASIANGASVRREPQWVVTLCRKLLELGALLPDWSTTSSRPAVLIYPRPEDLRKAQKIALSTGVHVETSGRQQVVHLDQAPGCEKPTNFGVPSDNRPFTTVYNVGERETMRFAQQNVGRLRAALDERGVFQTDVRPAGGKYALAFSGGSPHYGTGGDSEWQSAMVFFAGVGAAAHLSAAGTAAFNYYSGRSGDGKPRDCNEDGIYTVENMEGFAREIGTVGGRPVRITRKMDAA